MYVCTYYMYVALRLHVRCKTGGRALGGGVCRRLRGIYILAMGIHMGYMYMVCSFL